MCRYAQYRELRDSLQHSKGTDIAMTCLPRLPRGIRHRDEATGTSSVERLRAPERSEKLLAFLQHLFTHPCADQCGSEADGDVTPQMLLLHRSQIDTFFQIKAHTVDVVAAAMDQNLKADTQTVSPVETSPNRQMPPALPARATSSKAEDKDKDKEEHLSDSVLGASESAEVGKSALRVVDVGHSCFM
jgi:hypothetical protein